MNPVFRPVCPLVSCGWRGGAWTALTTALNQLLDHLHGEHAKAVIAVVGIET